MNGCYEASRFPKDVGFIWFEPFVFAACIFFYLNRNMKRNISLVERLFAKRAREVE